MNLFTIKHKLPLTDTKHLILSSPLGDIKFNCKIDGNEIVNMLPTKVESFQSNGYINTWISQEYRLEFLRLDFNPILPIGMKVDRCIAAVWRIKALKELNTCFTCYLDNHLEGSPDSGEYLISQAFENNLTNLSIGTEDEDSLKQRARAKKWLPFHFESKIKPDHIDYLFNGIKVLLPTLFKDDIAQIHFIISWSSKENEDVSNWYAVDQSPIKLLKQFEIF